MTRLSDLAGEAIDRLSNADRDQNGPADTASIDWRSSFSEFGHAAAQSSLSLEDTMAAAIGLLQQLLGNVSGRDSEAETILLASKGLAAAANGYLIGQHAKFPHGPDRDLPLSPLVSRLSALHRISRAATTTPSPGEFLDLSVNVIAEATKSDACAVFLYDAATDSLTLSAAVGLNPALVGAMTLRPGRGITGSAAVKREPIMAAEARTHPCWVPTSSLGDEIYSSQASIPMMLENPDRLVGVLNLLTLARREFDDADKSFLVDVASELAIGVEYAQLHSLTDERLRRKIIELGTLQRVSRSVASALDLSEVLRLVSEAAVELTNAEAAAVFKLPPEGGDAQSYPSVVHRVGRNREVTDELARADLVTSVIESDGARAVEMEYVDGSAMLFCIPLRSARERWGALCVRLPSGKTVTEDDLALLQAFTDTASIAIENAELYQDARDSAETASTLLQEMHHRVRNNLQTVAALLSLQLRQVEDTDAARHLQDAVGRVQAIASVHDLVSDASRLSGATIDSIARLVADELRVTLIRPTLHVDFTIEPSDIVVPPRQATVLALLFNELISNAVTHGFVDRGSGTAAVRARREGGEITIEVENDGQRVPSGFDASASSGIGLRIVRRLVESDLAGLFQIESTEAGTVARIHFPSAIS
jgi:two-component sensor histidine kinase/putative methionine-R-sulfoxide reductase with GAF domain